MGVYLPNMEMPKSCGDCPIGDALCCSLMPGVPALWKEYTISVRTNRRHSQCPLVHIPPHGRLIDADAFIKQKTELICENCDRRRGMKDGKLTKRFVYAIGDAPCRACDTGDMLDYVDDAPTIIQASGGVE